jgi:hypothetical protein
MATCSRSAARVKGSSARDVLRVLGLAIRLDDLAVDHNAGCLDSECSALQVEQVAASAGQLAPPHA